MTGHFRKYVDMKMLDTKSNHALRHEKNKNAMLVPGTQKLWTSSIFKITHQKNNKHAVGLPMLISMVT